MCGQAAVYQYLCYRAENFFNAQIKDGRYNVNDLTEVKIPAELPGIADWAGYELVSGRVQFANESYNYVKMRVTRHAIYLMCIPNYETTRFANGNIIHAENIKGVQIPKKEHVPAGKTTLSDNFSFTFTKFEFNSPFKNSVSRALPPVLPLTTQSLEIPEQPPKTC
ncbi:MAG: hypothetical protein ACXVJD_07725 [Mucilaginibacter sp.]